MHVAIDALAYVPDAQLTVIGDGPDRGRLEQHAQGAGLNGRVRFVGSLPRAEVLDALAGAEAAVLSSDWENFPHAAVEALAVGTPLVATAVGGVGEIVVDGVNGLLVPPGSRRRSAMRSSGCSGPRSCGRVFRMGLVRRSPRWARTASTDASRSCSRRRARGDERWLTGGARGS